MVHLLSCLVDSIEEDGNSEQDDPISTAHAETQQNLEKFDSYQIEHDIITYDNDAQESIDESIVTQDISNATSYYFSQDGQGLQLGDEKEHLNFSSSTHINYTVAPTHASEDPYDACRSNGV